MVGPRVGSRRSARENGATNSSQASGKIPGRPAAEGPVDLALPRQEDPSEDQSLDALRVRLGVREGERGAPGAAEDEPPVDPEVLADLLGVLDEVPGGVLAQLAERRRLAASRAGRTGSPARTAGSKNRRWIGGDPGSGTAVEEDDRPAGRVARLLHVEVVEVGDAQAERRWGSISGRGSTGTRQSSGGAVPAPLGPSESREKKASIRDRSDPCSDSSRARLASSESPSRAAASSTWRAARMREISSAIAGRASSTSRNLSLPSRQHSTSVTATTVARRGSPVSIPISPKMSGAEMRPTTRGGASGTATRTSPAPCVRM